MSNQRWETTAPQRPVIVAPWRRQVIEPVSATENIETEAWEQEAIAILERPITNESAAAGHARKEAELKVLLGGLGVAGSRALHARLTRPADGDELARLIGRMVPERRLRLIAFVADARRREAIATAVRTAARRAP